MGLCHSSSPGVRNVTSMRLDPSQLPWLTWLHGCMVALNMVALALLHQLLFECCVDLTLHHNGRRRGPLRRRPSLACPREPSFLIPGASPADLLARRCTHSLWHCAAPTFSRDQSLFDVTIPFHVTTHHCINRCLFSCGVNPPRAPNPGGGGVGGG